MEVTCRIDKDILYIAIEGRVDASNAAAAEEKIFEVRNANKDKHTVVDADKLEYISSAGLRIILKLRKDDAGLAIINVSPDVYEVFDMTGFTDMVKVEKAYRRISVEGCEFLAKGATGAVYRFDDETIVKTYFAKDALPEILQERENARKAFVLGVNTAIPYGIVRVNDGYGTLTELLNATSITKMIRKDPEDLEEAANYFVDMLKAIHAIKVTPGELPNVKEKAEGWADFVAPHLSKENSEKLCALIKSIPEDNTLLHGDYHTNNIMVQNGEPIIIDLDTLCVGHPIFELGPMFNAFIGFSEPDPDTAMDFFGFDFDTATRFWNIALKKYLGSDDEAYCRQVEEKAMVIGYVRILRRSLRRPNEKESPARIALCKERLAELLPKVDTLVF